MAYDFTLNGISFGNAGGAFGQAAVGDANGYGEAANAAIPQGNTPFTLECRFNVSSTSFAVMIGQGGAAWIGIDGGALRGTYGTNDADAKGTTNCTDGAWHHAEFNVDPTGATPSRLFLDGVLQASVTAARTIGNGKPFALRALGGIGLGFGGSVDEVAIWNGIRHTANFTPPTAPIANNAANLRALWHLDGNGVDSAGAAPVIADTTPPTLTMLGTNSDGTVVYVTANETLGTGAVNPARFAFSGNHTASAVSMTNSIAAVTVAPAITAGETLTATYTAAADGIKDTAGNQLPSFVNQPVANNVGLGFWKYLGGEGTTVTVPAGSKVRYGIDGKYFEAIKSGSVTFDNATFGDPAPGAAKHGDILVSDPATGYTVTGPNIGPTGESGLFTVSTNGLLSGDLIITPTAPGLTFSPATVTLNNSALTASFIANATAAGDFDITYTNNKGFANPAVAPYKAVTSLYRTFGTGAEYATMQEAMASVWGLDPVAARLMIVIEGWSDVAGVNAIARPVNANESFYYIIRAKPSLSFAGLNQNGAIHESMSGLTMNLPSGSQLTLDGGVVVEGWKINITTPNGLQWGKEGAAPISRLDKCFVLANADNAMGNRAYKTSEFRDCVIKRTSAHTGKYFDAPWAIRSYRTTWIGNPTVTKVHNGGWGSGSSFIEDSVYQGFGPDPIDGIGGFSRTNNYTDSTMTDSGGFTVDKINQFFKAANNYRAGPALKGKGGQNSRSVNDILGNNRGTTPDVGAGQDVPAIPLPILTVTNQPAPDGTRVVISGTYTGTLNDAFINFVPASPSKGAVLQGPFPITFAGGNWTVTRDGVLPGAYVPEITGTNSGGSQRATNAKPFEINGVNAFAEDPGVQSAATAVVWNPPPSGLVGQASNPFTVGLNGTYTGTVRITPNDNGAGGTFNPAYVDSVNGAAGSFTYTPSSTGVKNITLANNKSLTNPAPSDYTATAPVVIVAKVELPLTTDGTTAVADMVALSYAWFDQALPQNFTAPKLKGNNGEIAGGKFNLTLTGSVLNAGDTGYLVLSNTNGDVAQNPAALVFSGPVKVS